MIEGDALAVSLPGLRAYRHTVAGLYAGVKHYYAVGRTERGRSEWWGRGRVWQTTPGTVQVKEPGDVHRDVRREGPTTFAVVVLPTSDIERVRDEGKVASAAQLAAGDPRALPFHRLHDAICAGADRLTLEVALAEAVATFARLGDARSEHTRPVRRAVEYLRARLGEAVTLDDLAAHASLDKFHLCRAFRAQVGLPPHAYLTHLRIQRAKELLAEGVRASELAPRVGLYDQSQLTRHFRRIVGTTPARYASDRRMLAVV
jgi:AraC-like DNA-binding protein